MSGTSVISARRLRKDHGKETGLTHAVAGIDLDVMTGETVAIMGPSGCGKSTLLHLLSGLDRPSGGTVLLAGHRVDQMGERGLARLRRGVTGFVFQAFHLMDELTAVENVELAALLAGLAETDHGRHHREKAEKPQVSQDRYVTSRETLHDCFHRRCRNLTGDVVRMSYATSW